MNVIFVIVRIFFDVFFFYRKYVYKVWCEKTLPNFDAESSSEECEVKKEKTSHSH